MGVSIGDRIEVTLEADTAERVVEVPPDLEAAMKKDRAARKAFDGLAFTHRKEYARWVGEAKREETRKARVGKTIAMLKAGTKHP